MSPVAGLLAALRSRGIILEAHGDQLRYRPRSAMTPGLQERLTAHKTALLAMLRAQAAQAAQVATEAARAIPEPPEPRASHEAPEAGRGISEPPTARAGFVTELVLRAGRWAWRQRRADDADRALAGYQRTTAGMGWCEACALELARGRASSDGDQG